MTIETDALIVGAGPSGLFQVFELGLLGVRCHVVDSMPQAGGQCAELYPDKPIYDIPALPVVGAQELVDRLCEQIQPFEPVFHLGERVDSLERSCGGFDVRTSAGTRFFARSVVIAGGVGAFEPRRLKVAGADVHEGTRLHYRVTDASRFDGQRLVILGGGDSALDWTLELAGRAASVTLVHRSDQFRASDASVDKMRALVAAGRIALHHGTVSELHEQDGRLQGLTLTATDGETKHLELDHLLVFWGLHPKLGPIAEWGLNLHRNQIEVDTARFQTCVPGIYAVGDINWYEGKRKLILSGFHEAALAAFAIKEQLSPGKKVMLQYTTTSPKMHERLGLKKAS